MTDTGNLTGRVLDSPAWYWLQLRDHMLWLPRIVLVEFLAYLAADRSLDLLYVS